MTRASTTALHPDGTGLLERAISYALAAAAAVTPELLSNPTPCRSWDLRMLLRHANESLTALHEGIASGCVALGASAESDLTANPAQTFRDRACHLLDARIGADDHRLIAIADHCITFNVMACAGALEIAVHGWDISQACGQRRPIPHALATDLLPISPLLATRAGRPPLFAAPVTVAPTASPSDQLAAFLGRTPLAWAEGHASTRSKPR